MTPATRTVIACQAGAFLSAASAGYSLTWHPWYALPGLVGAGFLLWGAASARAATDRQQARRARLDHAARADAALLAARSCGAPHHLYPETLCTEPADHYVRDRDSHAGPLIISGRECGGAAWDEPRSAA
ncbi:hypothetical protein [Streptomyces sp. ME01-18h]|uniref:hypothetical protein n=1 Tax=Streptomyces sp. ME01-18h TaxID=462920 RepID=UPI0029B9CFDE|nr:hypothetical protein [Streptomyces sp. ME01-18h]MDX3398414.1 hypothetical protein [Streptomyces sp. ME01-18h]